MAKNLATLVAAAIKARKMKEAAEEALKARIEAFENSEEVQALKSAVHDGDEGLEKARLELIEEMQKQKMNEFDGDAGRASLSRRVSLVWGDEQKVIDYIEKNGTPEMKENVKVTKKLGKSTTLKKTIQELLEIDKPQELIDTGTKLEESFVVTLTARDNAAN